MRELRIASAPMIRNIRQNTEVATLYLQINKLFEKDEAKISNLQLKIKENEEFIDILDQILENQNAE
jgi:hypothetical protein